MSSREMLIKEIKQIPEFLIGDVLNFIKDRTREREDQSDVLTDKTDLDVLAVQQGILPITEVDTLTGDFWPEEENLDDFITTVRAWRDSEGENI